MEPDIPRDVRAGSVDGFRWEMAMTKILRRLRHELALWRLSREIDRVRRRLGLTRIGRDERKSLVRRIIDAGSLIR